MEKKLTIQKNKREFPPLVEVGIGFLFQSLDIDAMTFGRYSNQKSQEYPSTQLVSPLSDEFTKTLKVGFTHHRSWLLSEDKKFILQLQHDRFYVNWRGKGGDDYPHFQGKDNSLKDKSILEFKEYQKWLTSDCNKTPSLEHLEIIKVNVFKKGTHYSSLNELHESFLLLKNFQELEGFKSNEIQLKMKEIMDDKHIYVTISLQNNNVQLQLRGVSTCVVDVVEDILTDLNQDLNKLFFSLVDVDRLFGGNYAARYAD